MDLCPQIVMSLPPAFRRVDCFHHCRPPFVSDAFSGRRSISLLSPLQPMKLVPTSKLGRRFQIPVSLDLPLNMNDGRVSSLAHSSTGSIITPDPTFCLDPTHRKPPSLEGLIESTAPNGSIS
ncbi:hypothetical protein K443DRAFT_503219 [Laccaria amethystina LaAM-08-1]|uniref:Uncharacterized protein n=1 Tax=Laccaria amethystina LaAM-08-1 TaxID=1095629 RepID=A0A0C9WUR3_9AGAR|nr:hypothetical protein K443DRAFT_503219 [Laccaria amethystina LaAM-08-1]